MRAGGGKVGVVLEAAVADVQAEVMVPLPEDREKGWNQKLKAEMGKAEIPKSEAGGQEWEMPKPKMVPVDFEAQQPHWPV